MSKTKIKNKENKQMFALVKSKINFDFSPRTFFKHFITLAYFGIILWLALRISFDVMKYSDTTYLKNKLKEIVWTLALIIVTIRTMVASLKMLSISYKTFIVNGIFVVTAFISVTIIVFYEQVSGTPEYIEQLRRIILIFIMFPAYISIWKFSIALFERKASPLLSKYLFHKSLISALMFITFIQIYNLIGITHTKVFPFKTQYSLWNYDHLWLTIGIFFANVGIAVVMWLNRPNKKALINDYNGKTHSLSINVVTVVPLTIWMLRNAWLWKSNPYAYLFLGIQMIAVGVVAFFMFIRKSELSSSKVFNVILFLALSIIWGMKLIFGVTLRYDVLSNFTLIISLISTSIIVMMLYIKTKHLTLFYNILIRVFIFFITICSILLWTLSYLPAISEAAISLIQASLAGLDPFHFINTILFVFPTLFLFLSIVSWYHSNARIGNIAKHVEIKLDHKNEVLNKGALNV